MVKLLCERGQSYADIGELLGISASEVRARTRAAMAELGGADPDAEVELTDYLVSQADPIGRADAVRQLQSDPELLELANLISLKIAAIAPEANLPKLPEPKGRARKAASSPAEPRPKQRRGQATAAPAAAEPSDAAAPEGAAATAATAAGASAATEGTGETDAAPEAAPSTVRRRLGARPVQAARLQMNQARLIAAGVGTTLLLVFVILGVAGAFSTDSGTDASDGSAASADDPLRQTVADALGVDPSEVTQADIDAFNSQRDITPVQLQPTGGSGVAAEANFGTENTTLFVDLEAAGLNPEPPDNTATVLWLLFNDKAGYPVHTLEPSQNGSIQNRYPIPAPVAEAVFGNARFVTITESKRGELQQAIETASQANPPAPSIPLVGKKLAQGEVPMAAPAAG